ncbi:type 4a pilus biogenesis protein PilO [candidate division KSB1 bacterium]|nr:type 4a pilus biogenesis protein PilO [candidate division KSB1 bacterium]
MFERIIDLYHLKKWMIYLCCFLLLLLWALLSSLFPQAVQTFRIANEIRINNQRVKQVENWGMTVQRLEVENKKLTSVLQEIQLQAPQDDELSYILNFFSEAAKTSKVSFLSIEPQETEHNPQYRVIPFHVQLTGSYHHLAKFLNIIETAKSVVKIDQLNIKTKGLIENELLVTMKISVYYLNK